MRNGTKILINKENKTIDIRMINVGIVEDNTEILGVNDKIQLELLTKVLRLRINQEHMKNNLICHSLYYLILLF